MKCVNCGRSKIVLEIRTHSGVSAFKCEACGWYQGSVSQQADPADALPCGHPDNTEILEGGRCAECGVVVRR
jgi:hypothetical protein